MLNISTHCLLCFAFLNCGKIKYLMVKGRLIIIFTHRCIKYHFTFVFNIHTQKKITGGSGNAKFHKERKAINHFNWGRNYI